MDRLIWLGRGTSREGRERHTLFPQVRLSLLDGGHDHVANSGGRQTVQAALDALDGDDVQVLSSGVVGTIDDCSDGETQRHAVLLARGSSSYGRVSLLSPLPLCLPSAPRPPPSLPSLYPHE